MVEAKILDLVQCTRMRVSSSSWRSMAGVLRGPSSGSVHRYSSTRRPSEQDESLAHFNWCWVGSYHRFHTRVFVWSLIPWFDHYHGSIQHSPTSFSIIHCITKLLIVNFIAYIKFVRALVTSIYSFLHNKSFFLPLGFYVRKMATVWKLYNILLICWKSIFFVYYVILLYWRWFLPLF